MSQEKNQNFREVLRSQLSFFEEQRLNFLDTYVSSQYDNRHLRKKIEQMIERYVDEVGRLVAMETLQPDPLERVLIGAVVIIRYEDELDTDTLTVCFPDQSDPDQGRISFLSPIGSQLLLARTNDVVQVSTPNGEMNISVEHITFQS